MSYWERDLQEALERSTVASLMNTRGLGVDEVAERCGVKPSQVQRYLEGRPTFMLSYNRLLLDVVLLMAEEKEKEANKMKRQEYSKTVWKWPEGAGKPLVVLVREIDPEGVRYHSNVWRKGFNTEDKYLTLADAKEHLESLQKLVDTWTEALQDQLRSIEGL